MQGGAGFGWHPSVVKPTQKRPSIPATTASSSAAPDWFRTTPQEIEHSVEFVASVQSASVAQARSPATACSAAATACCASLVRSAHVRLASAAPASVRARATQQVNPPKPPFGSQSCALAGAAFAQLATVHAPPAAWHEIPAGCEVVDPPQATTRAPYERQTTGWAKQGHGDSVALRR